MEAGRSRIRWLHLGRTSFYLNSWWNAEAQTTHVEEKTPEIRVVLCHSHQKPNQLPSKLSKLDEQGCSVGDQREELAPSLTTWIRSPVPAEGTAQRKDRTAAWSPRMLEWMLCGNVVIFWLFYGASLPESPSNPGHLFRPQSWASSNSE